VVADGVAFVGSVGEAVLVAEVFVDFGVDFVERLLFGDFKRREFVGIRSYPGVRTPFLSISMALPNLFNRVSSFLASVIQRQYSLRWV
jgi:hypothetical protein